MEEREGEPHDVPPSSSSLRQSSSSILKERVQFDQQTDQTAKKAGVKRGRKIGRSNSMKSLSQKFRKTVQLSDNFLADSKDAFDQSPESSEQLKTSGSSSLSLNSISSDTSTDRLINFYVRFDASGELIGARPYELLEFMFNSKKSFRKKDFFFILATYRIWLENEESEMVSVISRYWDSSVTRRLSCTRIHPDRDRTNGVFSSSFFRNEEQVNWNSALCCIKFISFWYSYEKRTAEKLKIGRFRSNSGGAETILQSRPENYQLRSFTSSASIIPRVDEEDTKVSVIDFQVRELLVKLLKTVLNDLQISDSEESKKIKSIKRISLKLLEEVDVPSKGLDSPKRRVLKKDKTLLKRTHSHSYKKNQQLARKTSSSGVSPRFETESLHRSKDPLPPQSQLIKSPSREKEDGFKISSSPSRRNSAFRRFSGLFSTSPSNSTSTSPLSSSPLIPRMSLCHSNSINDVSLSPPLLSRNSPFDWIFNSPFVNSKDLAQQFTLWEAGHMAMVSLPELLSLGWTKSNKKMLTPTINFMMNWFNTCSYGIAASLIKIPSADKRALALNRIIEAASECERLNNFNSLMTMLSALNQASVSRLKQSWNLVTAKAKETQDKLMAIMSHLGGFSAYRKTLTEVSPMKPCLPYLGVILSDLVHVNEKPTYLGPSSSSIERLASSSSDDILGFEEEPEGSFIPKSDRLVNVTKMRELGKILSKDFFEPNFQGYNESLEKDPVYSFYLEKASRFDLGDIDVEDHLWQLSEEAEGPIFGSI